MDFSQLNFRCQQLLRRCLRSLREWLKRLFSHISRKVLPRRACIRVCTTWMLIIGACLISDTICLEIVFPQNPMCFEGLRAEVHVVIHGVSLHIPLRHDLSIRKSINFVNWEHRVCSCPVMYMTIIRKLARA